MCYCVCMCVCALCLLVCDRDSSNTRYVLQYCVCFPSATSQLFDLCVKFNVIMDWFLNLVCFSKATNMLMQTYYSTRSHIHARTYTL